MEMFRFTENSWNLFPLWFIKKKKSFKIQCNYSQKTTIFFILVLLISSEFGIPWVSGDISWRIRGKNRLCY